MRFLSVDSSIYDIEIRIGASLKSERVHTVLAVINLYKWDFMEKKIK